jgi:hypothetical protein
MMRTLKRSRAALVASILPGQYPVVQAYTPKMASFLAAEDTGHFPFQFHDGIRSRSRHTEAPSEKSPGKWPQESENPCVTP